MAGRRFFPRRSAVRRPQPNYTWITSIGTVSNLASGSAGANANVLTAVDWSAIAGTQKCTLLRSIITVEAASAQHLASGQVQLRVGLGIVNVGETIPPVDSSFPNSCDCLWMDFGLVTTGTGWETTTRLVFDSKVKRKLSEDSIVALCMRNFTGAAADSINVTYLTRFLVARH